MGKASRWFRRLLCLRKQPPPPQSKHPHRPVATAEVSGQRRNVGPADFIVKPAAAAAHVNRERASVRAAAVTAPAHLSRDRAATCRPGQAREERGAAVTAREAQVSVRRPVNVSEHRAVTEQAHVSKMRAAVMIQAHFRSYLARRALRALKSLVKLQALVRGHIIRKQTADMLRRMHALIRAQARARAGRAQISDSPSSSAKSSQFCQPGPPTPEKSEHIIRSNSARRDHSPILKRNGSKSASRRINDQQNSWYLSDQIKCHSAKYNYAENENSDKIVEIDPIKSNTTSKKKSLFHSPHLGLSSDQYSHSFSTSKDSTTHQTVPSPSSYEVRSFSPMKATTQITDESPFFCTAQNSPQFCSASSRGGSSRRSPFTPTKSYLSGYSDHPSYMAYTESSKAKIRSVSAPRQRPQIERSGSARRYLVYSSYDEPKISAQKGSGFYASFVNKAYPGSGRLDRLGVPAVINSGYLNGY